MPIIFTNKRLVDYSDSEDDGDDQIRPPPRKKKRVMVIFSDYEEEDSFDSLYTIKAKSEIDSRKFKTKSKVYSVDVKKFPDKNHQLNLYQNYFSRWLTISKGTVELKETTSFV